MIVMHEKPQTAVRSNSAAAESSGKRLLIIDFSGREQFPPAVLKPLFEASGDIQVLRTNPAGIRSTLRSMMRLARTAPRRFRARLALWLFGSADECADPSIRSDLQIGQAWRIRHIRPAAWSTPLRTAAALLSPATWRAASAMRQGRFAHLVVANRDISGYVLDSILRWHRGSVVFTWPAALALPYTALLVARYVGLAHYARQLADRMSFTDVLVNHTVYAECGMIAAILQARLGPELKGHIASYLHSDLAAMPTLPFCAYTAVTDQELRSASALPDATPPDWYTRNSITHSIGRQRTTRKRHVMLAMHCLRDSCDVYGEHDSTYPTYFSWIEDSLRVARNSPSLSLLLRRHPAHALYGAEEERLTRFLFENRAPNCTVLEGGLADVQEYLAESVVVTFKGSIALELACAGKRVVTLARANCPDAVYTRLHTRADYHRLLLGEYLDFDDELDAAEIALAERYRRAYYRVLERTVAESG